MRWYSRAPGRGGGGVDGQAWLIGIEATETPNLHIDHVTGTQWGNSNGGFGPTGSIGVHLVSTGGSSDFFEQQVWLTNYSQQGGYRGVVVDGHNLQGLYASGLFLLQNFISIDWEAPSEDASASFTLTNSSLDGQQDGVLLANVKQVMITNTEILNGNSNGLATKVPNDYHGIYDIGADDVMISNNVLIPACSACSSSGVAAGHKGYGIFILHHAADDGQGSVISGNSIAYGDVGISAQSTGAVIACSGTLASATFNLPAHPAPSQTFHVASECTITAFRLVPQPVTARTTVVGAPGSITPATPLTFIYDASSNVWLRW